MRKKNVILSCFCLLMTCSAALPSEWFPEIGGWKMEEDERVYTSADLWELIDGAAEAFLSYGFSDLHLAEYTMGEQIIRVEIYHHSSPENAYGMYAAERMPDYDQIVIGAQGYTSEGILNFFAGPYYLKIMAVGLAEVSPEDIRQVAEQMDRHLDQSRQMPETLSLLPEEGMEYLSDRYIATDFLGYSFLHSAYTASYENNGTFTLFIIHASPEEIQTMLEGYRALLKEDKFQEKNSLIVINDMFNGTLFLSEQSGYLVGVMNTEDENKATDYIGRVMAKIPGN